MIAIPGPLFPFLRRSSPFFSYALVFFSPFSGRFFFSLLFSSVIFYILLFSMGAFTIFPFFGLEN